MATKKNKNGEVTQNRSQLIEETGQYKIYQRNKNI